MIAAAHTTDRNHARCVEVLANAELRLVIPALVVAEACYLIADRVSTRKEAAFVDGLVDEDIRAPLPGEWPRMAELMRQYADFPLGAADASVVVLAERLETDVVITLDRRHFSAIRPRHCEHLRLLPE